MSEAKTPKEVTVFFSWQSDSPKETNSSAIRESLKAVSKSFQKKFPDTKLKLDEATRNTSGSPNIADKIIEKIESANIFIADITTVSPPTANRPSANPNVLIELGFAISQVGWDRIILLFNDCIGKFPGDLPFDIIQNRVSTYTIDPSIEDNKKGKDGLQALLAIAIKSIIEKNPKTPAELKGVSPEKVKHERDVESVKWLLSQIHIPTLQEHIEGLPRYIHDRIFWFWESFKGVVTNKLIHLYDEVLEEAVCDLFLAWGTSLEFYMRYHDAAGKYVFANPGDAPLDKDQEKDWMAIEVAAAEMNEALLRILNRVRSSYLEVDIMQTNTKAWKDYLEFHNQLEKSMPI